MNTLFDLSGKVAIVTGCNTGLGQGMAVALAQAGCHIVGVNRSDSSDTRERVQSNGQSYLEVRVDLGDTKVIDSILKATLDKFGRVDVLVNNAGIIRRNDAVDFTEADWDAVMDLNSKSLFFLSQAVAKQFISQGEGGKIINIASMLSFQGGIRVPSYTASKSAVLGLTRLMANEWAKYGICTNAIAPGYMATNNTEALQQDESRNREILGRIPAGRWGTPQDMAGACIFLASDAANYVNGHTLAVDGGWLAR
ncbi:2-dehydro-3-deoxy-D-gluconate 5-dehydrogenase KduD [Vibrio ulleungensis]|uniref:2-dehydro-3-deoxy-D-gluconate 5-dehydrogenase KduD n=1 Tax=Vibrio ulleungensis TaxID=2807619 RepID=A0ABS2HDK0_9VIBR|nr:2-dehydro-3-deoxy-D-gluconate 5-dehydrogenase KduD [Vibrio ulleungensis]MBM7035074.1 2-dehydro-3-deoxy-D-gluconate 5-dehydrogenase KduD [Vibrio ulleungensis]